MVVGLGLHAHLSGDEEADKEELACSLSFFFFFFAFLVYQCVMSAAEMVLLSFEGYRLSPHLILSEKAIRDIAKGVLC